MKFAVAILSLVLIFWSGASFGQSALRETSAELNSELNAGLNALSLSLPAAMKPGGGLRVSEFCRINGLRDALESWHETNKDWLAPDPWTGTLIPTLQARSEVYQTYADPKSIAELSMARNLTVAEAQSCTKRIETLKQGEMDQADIARATALQSAFFCKDVTFLHLNQCARLVPKLMDLVRPHGDMNLFDAWQIALTNPAYLKVIVKVANANARLIEKKEAPSSRLFDDLLTAFTTELRSKVQALDATFHLLGILSSNGNNSYRFIPCEIQAKASGFENALKVLGLSSTLLDRLAAPKGFLYTSPKEVDSLCDYGKSYHFWMAAYLAREGTKLTGDAVASAAAAFTLNKGYQFMKVDNGRDPRKAFVENTFSNYNNNMRLDMTQAAAGAWFGAQSVRAVRPMLTQAQFNEALLRMFEGAKETPRDPNFEFPASTDIKKLLTTYSVWKKTMNPDAAFESIEKIVESSR